MANAHTLTGHATISWRGVFWSGLIAGAVFLMLEMLLVPLLMGGSPWGPPRMIAAMAYGRGVLPPPASFDMGIVLSAMIIHFTLSWILAAAFAWAFGGLSTGTAVIVGAVAGLLLYFINFYGFTAIWPWFAEARNFLSLSLHVVFGAVLAWSYMAIARKQRHL